MTHEEAHKAAVEKAGEAAAIHSNTPNAAEAAITAYLAAMEAAGFVVVPVKATPEMAKAAVGRDRSSEATIFHGMYRAMLASRPKEAP